jgi:hypothetical protein
MPKILKYDFCVMEIYDDYLIAIMNKDIHLTPDRNQILVDIANTHFANKPFVYITHRKYSYSVDPSIYTKTSKIPNLSGFAVVAEVPVSKSNAEIERLFLNKPFEIFSKLDDAIEWANQLIQNG